MEVVQRLTRKHFRLAVFVMYVAIAIVGSWMLQPGAWLSLSMGNSAMGIPLWRTVVQAAFIAGSIALLRWAFADEERG